ncbi:MAG: GntR family transcriptional regulator [Clostridia bacterium]|nr:GntR family transcriptional regulator [Clostridia bacterium]
MFQIDPMARTPIYEQLTAQIERLVLLGVLQPGDALPSVRNLSCELAVNPNTVQKAFNELYQRGVLAAVPGRGCFVAPDAREHLQTVGREKLDGFRELAHELLLAGISKKDLIDAIDQADKKEGEAE